MPSSRSRDCHQPVLCGAAGLGVAGAGRGGGAGEAVATAAGGSRFAAGGAAGSFQGTAAWNGWWLLSFWDTTSRGVGERLIAFSSASLVAS